MRKHLPIGTNGRVPVQKACFAQELLQLDIEWRQCDSESPNDE